MCGYVNGSNVYRMLNTRNIRNEDVQFDLRIFIVEFFHKHEIDL